MSAVRSPPPPPPPPHPPTRASIYSSNRSFYDTLWGHARLDEPEAAETWEPIRELIAGRKRLLEIGPGLRPRLPFERATFVDLSRRAARGLRPRARSVVLGNGAQLPFADGAFEVVCALDVVEHADRPDRVLAEAARVLEPGGDLLLAVPVHQAHWSRFDALVGHHCRFEAAQLTEIARRLRLSIERSAAFGSVPRSRLLMDIGAWFLERFPGAAVRFEDRVVRPLVRRLHRPIRWERGLRIAPRADGVLVHCTKGP